MDDFDDFGGLDDCSDSGSDYGSDAGSEFDSDYESDSGFEFDSDIEADCGSDYDLDDYDSLDEQEDYITDDILDDVSDEDYDEVDASVLDEEALSDPDIEEYDEIDSIGEMESESDLEEPEMIEPLPDEDVKILTRQFGPDEETLREIGANTIENTLDAVRDDLRDKEITDPEEVERIIAEERQSMQDQFESDLRGDFTGSGSSASYGGSAENLEEVSEEASLETADEADYETVDEQEIDLEEDLSDLPDEAEELEEDLSDLPDEAGELREDLSDLPEEAEDLGEDLSDLPDEAEELEEDLSDLSDEAEEIEQDPDNIDYDSIVEELHEFDIDDFDGIDVQENPEELDNALQDFNQDTWEGLDLDQKQEAVRELSDWLLTKLELTDAPQVEFYNGGSDNGEYGYYSSDDNKLFINSEMLGSNSEAADTVAHELWHAYQHQCAENPGRAKDYQYQYGFEHYIFSDVDFEGYQDQLVEAEARAFAEQLKRRLK